LLAAEGWLELGNHGEAAAELIGLPPDLEDSPHALRLKVEIAVAMDNGMEAVRHATRLTAIEIKDPSAWLLLSSACLFPYCRPDWAVRALRTALVSLPDHPVLLFALAGAEDLVGNQAEAERLEERASHRALVDGSPLDLEELRRDMAKSRRNRLARSSR
jgi:predicted Zn-dependent protease